ncbi:MAG TPA: ADP-ribosylglycohydrolase family protein [Acidimicrobiales bacterium]|nr:ADP-ribosylglycohydrolase family protein [Acidimicrobiales bacterium]
MTSTLSAIQKGRAAGVLVGAAAGDALGAGYEFGTPCAPEHAKMLRGALTGRPAGSWTDDTDMAICVA